MTTGAPGFWGPDGNGTARHGTAQMGPSGATPNVQPSLLLGGTAFTPGQWFRRGRVHKACRPGKPPRRFEPPGWLTSPSCPLFIEPLLSAVPATRLRGLHVVTFVVGVCAIGQMRAMPRVERRTYTDCMLAEAQTFNNTSGQARLLRMATNC